VEATGDWRENHEELHNLYSSPNVVMAIKSRRMRLVGHVSGFREMRNPYKILVRKPEGMRPLERGRHRWEDNVRMNLN
jgi:hypothetical protein